MSIAQKTEAGTDLAKATTNLRTKGETILSFKDELPSWRDVSDKLDRLYESRKPEKQDQVCPFCGRTNVRTEIMETVNGLERGTQIGFFTCKSCNESWSGLLK